MPLQNRVTPFGNLVAVADRGVEPNQLLAMLAHLAGEASHPLKRAVSRDGHHRSPGVFTGASQ